MTTDEIISEIERIFPDAKCELNHETPFQLLVAVVLSAQTTDASVNRVTPALFKKWPDAKSLMDAPLSDVEQTLRTLGLYRTKSKNIIALSRALQENFGGQVPQTFRELQSLPGVGRKTANVVRSVAFDIPSFAVDTHVERVSKRLGLAKPQDDVLKVEEKLRRKISRTRWNQAHHDLIFFGRYFCMARKPRCEECPFALFCKKTKLDAYSAALKEKKKMADQTNKTGNDELVLDEANVLMQAETAMMKGSEKADRSNEKELDAASDAQSLQQVIDSKIIDEEQEMEENKVKTALIDELG